MTRSTRLLFVAILFFTTGLSAQDLTPQFDELLSTQFPEDGPGAAALVAKDGEVIYRKAFGMANLELSVPMRPDHIFRIGSITKQFTAAAILRLAEEGKLALQDDITKYLPGYPAHGHTITIEHLLTHTSGIRSYTGMPEWTAEVRKKDFSPEEMIDFFKNQPMDFAPGERFRYNNSGYFLLGYIIEKVSGQTYADFLDTYFFQPLGMEHSAYDRSAPLIKNRVPGYQRGQDEYENADFLSMTQPYAAGSLLSTVDDLLTWYQAVSAGQVLNPSSLEKAHTPFVLNSGEPVSYGYGWFLKSVQGSPTFEHTGGINGFLTASIYLPEEKVFVTVFSNCTCKDPIEVADRMAGFAVGKPLAWEKIELEPTELASYVGVYKTTYGGQRIITLEDGQLYSQQPGGGKEKLFPYATDRFFFAEGLNTLTFGRGPDGRIANVSLGGRSRVVTWQRTDLPIPVRKTIEVAPDVLAGYVGRYELAADFIIAISLKEGQLVMQAADQLPVVLYPERTNFFFLKKEDVQIEFLTNAEGTVDRLMLYQGAEHYPARRLE